MYLRNVLQLCVVLIPRTGAPIPSNERALGGRCALNTLSEIAPAAFGGLAPQPPRGSSLGQGVSWLLAWRERRFANKRCKELLALHAKVAAEQPLMARETVYREVVMRRVRCTEVQAEELIECARDSYAEWPVRRQLRLRDVAHYLIVCEYCASQADSGWVLSTLGRVVADCIPIQH